MPCDDDTLLASYGVGPKTISLTRDVVAELLREAEKRRDYLLDACKAKPTTPEPLYQVYILDPGGEGDKLVYSGPSVTEAERTRDWAKTHGLTASIEQVQR